MGGTQASFFATFATKYEPIPDGAKTLGATVLSWQSLLPGTATYFEPAVGYPCQIYSRASGSVCCFTARSVCPAFPAKTN